MQHSRHEYAMYFPQPTGSKMGFFGCGGRFGSTNFAGPLLNPLVAGTALPFARGIIWIQSFSD